MRCCLNLMLIHIFNGILYALEPAPAAEFNNFRFLLTFSPCHYFFSSFDFITLPITWKNARVLSANSCVIVRFGKN